ncbi:RNA binding protein [Purpureocillium lavendulum]|uniref:RNA binding protein n=1 Tax=Purpureocillium lavendulum TaxID=1247861 RepID=A0AB34G6W4_9HYPO|nr:RNA binding protein [Purpureocillium lavendulum]
MADKMDRGLDEIIADTRSSGPRNRRGGGDRRRDRNDRNDYPRDGVRKSSGPNLISTVADSRRAPASHRRRDSPSRREPTGSKLKVENIHYDLTEDDLDELFTRIGPVTRLQLLYDRAGRSEGTAYVTYEHRDDAQDAIRQFDGANANGQPIRLTLLPSRNPFDTAVMPGRPLAERISAPGGRARSLSPRRRYEEDDAARKGIDRREGPAKEQQAGRGTRGNPRTKKTQEELDAEMEDYFGSGSGGAAAAAAGSEQQNGKADAVAAHNDIDMIE